MEDRIYFLLGLKSYEEAPAEHQLLALVKGLDEEGVAPDQVADALRAVLYEWCNRCLETDPFPALDFIQETALGFTQLHDRFWPQAPTTKN